MTPVNQALLDSLKEIHGNWATYQDAIATQPLDIQKLHRTPIKQGGFALPEEVLEAFQLSEEAIAQ